MKFAGLFLLLALLPGCAVKRHWVSSEQAYDRWMIAQCTKQYSAAQCDPNWHPCTQTTTMEGEQVCQ